jgi:hypothetical protein
MYVGIIWLVRATVVGGEFCGGNHATFSAYGS